MDLKARLRSTFMRSVATPGYLERRHRRARLLNKLRNAPHTVHYFHQVDDPYSHLAVQKLLELQNRYDLTWSFHLVGSPSNDYKGDPQRFSNWAYRDAHHVAAFFDTDMPTNVDSPDPRPHREQVKLANEILAPQVDSSDFATAAYEVGTKLWRGTPLDPGLERYDADSAMSKGNALREKLGHYQSAMFYFEGEWYWGVDRLHHLESRLQSEGFDRQSGTVLVPRPELPTISADTDASDVTLEYFPSLRSPYTAIGHPRVADLIERTGVTLKLRPVMPMMMRGVPAPPNKGRYILSDAAREARSHGVAFGHIVDPFGDPVKRAYALFPAVARRARGLAYVGSYLSAAFAEGIDITRHKGLKQVVERIGLPFEDVSRDAKDDDWQSLLEGNLDVLLTRNLWGTPSFRVSGGTRDSDDADSEFMSWGQDRIWRVAHEILRRCEPHSSDLPDPPD